MTARRINITIDEALLAEIDAACGFMGRSAFLADAAREKLMAMKRKVERDMLLADKLHSLIEFENKMRDYPSQWSQVFAQVEYEP